MALQIRRNLGPMQFFQFQWHYAGQELPHKKKNYSSTLARCLETKNLFCLFRKFFCWRAEFTRISQLICRNSWCCQLEQKLSAKQCVSVLKLTMHLKGF